MSNKDKIFVILLSIFAIADYYGFIVPAIEEGQITVQSLCCDSAVLLTLLAAFKSVTMRFN